MLTEKKTKFVRRNNIIRIFLENKKPISREYKFHFTTNKKLDKTFINEFVQIKHLFY